jgi:magnesium chelatase family protein
MKYLERVSGPLLDRIDIQIELPSVSYDEISGKSAAGEPSKNIRARVNAARKFTDKRLREAGDSEGTLNANMSVAMLQKHCKPTPEGEKLMREAFESLGLSARGHDRVLRVARTIADLDGEIQINEVHIAEAIMYRSLDRKYWRRYLSIKPLFLQTIFYKIPTLRKINSEKKKQTPRASCTGRKL